MTIFPYLEVFATATREPFDDDAVGLSVAVFAPLSVVVLGGEVVVDLSSELESPPQPIIASSARLKRAITAIPGVRPKLPPLLELPLILAAGSEYARRFFLGSLGAHFGYASKLGGTKFLSWGLCL